MSVVRYADEVVGPYARLAPFYDDVIGRPFLRGLCRAFEHLTRRYNIHFRSAADLGCGTGLFADFLSRRWRVPVFAVDLSRPMLEVGRRRATPRVAFLNQDIRALRLPRRVDLVTANFDTINHLLRPRDVQRAFRRVAHALLPGGHFIFDAITPCICRAKGRRIRRRLSNGATVTQQVTNCAPGGRASIALVYKRADGRTLRVSNVEHAHSVGDLCRWLSKCGLETRGIHDASPARSGGACPARVIIVARKNGQTVRDRHDQVGMDEPRLLTALES